MVSWLLPVVFRQLGSEASFSDLNAPCRLEGKEPNMTDKWPRFVTHDLGDSEEDSVQMTRRWEEYDREMKAIIAKGGVHQDADGWWVDDATGELIGSDPEIERPLTEAEASDARPFKEVFPKLHERIQRARGRPPVEKPKEAVTLRIDPDTLARFKAAGRNWRTKMAEALDRAKI
jgi:uncharacterized protein (DUF4415 family)